MKKHLFRTMLSEDAFHRMWKISDKLKKGNGDVIALALEWYDYTARAMGSPERRERIPPGVKARWTRLHTHKENDDHGK